MGDFLGFSRLEETTPPQYGFSCISLARRKTSHNNSAKAILDLSLKDLLLTSIDQDPGCAQIEFVVNISVEALGEMQLGPGVQFRVAVIAFTSVRADSPTCTQVHKQLESTQLYLRSTLYQ